MHPFFRDGYRSHSLFSTSAFIDRMLRGQGGRWLTYVERSIERCQAMGFDGGRTFDETTGWNGDHKFFNESRATSDRMHDYNELRQGIRPGRNTSAPAVTVHRQLLLLWYLKLARKHDFRWDISIDATLKHTDGVSWDVIGQVIRQTANFWSIVHSGKWDTGPDGNSIGHPKNEKANARVRKLFDEVAGPLTHLIATETHNEYNAHSGGSMRLSYDNNVEARGLREVNKQLERMKTRPNGPGDFPAIGCWVSPGGGDTIAYDLEHADALAFHPSRPGTRVGDRFDHLIAKANKHKIPVYSNERLHSIAPEYWWTVESGWFRPNSSTQNHNALLKMDDEMEAKGIHICHHGLAGMSNFMWHVSGDDYEEMAVEPYEQVRRDRHNGNGGGSPPPVVTPPPKLSQLDRIENNTEEILRRLK